jgi:hypothetical protein
LVGQFSGLGKLFPGSVYTVSLVPCDYRRAFASRSGCFNPATTACTPEIEIDVVGTQQCVLDHLTPRVRHNHGRARMIDSYGAPDIYE